MPIPIVIFEDNADYRDSLQMVLSEQPDFDVVGVFDNVMRAEKQIQEHRPRVIFMDIDMPGRTGIDALKGIKKIHPEAEVIMLTIFDESDHIFEAICAGASGYLLKHTDPARMVSAVHEVLEGGAPMTSSIARKALALMAKPIVPKGVAKTPLTEREHEILQLLVRGLSYKMIADQLQLSINSVRSHIRNIYGKLQVHSATEALARLQNR